jgi:hypothetical protein
MWAICGLLLFRISRICTLVFSALLSRISKTFEDQAQASDQFLATTKLATNKAISLKTKKINKSEMYFKIFLATNNKYISVIAHSTHWIDIWAYRDYFWKPPPPNVEIRYISHTDTHVSKRQYFLCSISHVHPNIKYFFSLLQEEIHTGMHSEWVIQNGDRLHAWTWLLIWQWSL